MGHGDPGRNRYRVGARVFDATTPHASGGTYVNFMTEDESGAAAAYGANYVRLADIKKQRDPENVRI
jgi:hypothetical protein